MKHWIKFLPDSYGCRHLANDIEIMRLKLNDKKKQVEYLEKELREMEENSLHHIEKEWSETEIHEAKAKASKLN